MSYHISRIALSPLDRHRLQKSGLVVWPNQIAELSEQSQKPDREIDERRAALDAAMLEIRALGVIPRGSVQAIAARHGVTYESLQTRIHRERWQRALGNKLEPLAKRRARLDAAMAEVKAARTLPRGAIIEIAKRHGVSPESIHTRIFNERHAGAKPRKAA